MMRSPLADVMNISPGNQSNQEQRREPKQHRSQTSGDVPSTSKQTKKNPIQQAHNRNRVAMSPVNSLLLDLGSFSEETVNDYFKTHSGDIQPVRAHPSSSFATPGLPEFDQAGLTSALQSLLPSNLDSTETQPQMTRNLGVMTSSKQILAENLPRSEISGGKETLLIENDQCSKTMRQDAVSTPPPTLNPSSASKLNRSSGNF